MEDKQEQKSETQRRCLDEREESLKCLDEKEKSLKESQRAMVEVKLCIQQREDNLRIEKDKLEKQKRRWSAEEYK